MSCTKMAEPTEVHFGMLSRVGPENMYYMGVDAPRERTLLGCLGDWKAL